MTRWILPLVLCSTLLFSGCLWDGKSDYPHVAHGAKFHDIDCDQISGEVEVNGPDPYHLDADGDGVGCEPDPDEPDLSADDFYR